MKQFLMLVGVAEVAGAMYVAGASGSQQTKFAPEAQVVALQKKVKALTNKINKTVAPEANAVIGIIADCYLTIGSSTATANGLGVSQLGSTNGFGYLWGNSQASSPTTALDVVTSAPHHYVQEVTPNCVGGNLLRHSAVRSGNSLLQRWAKHSR